MPVIHETLGRHKASACAHYTEIILPAKRPLVKYICTRHRGAFHIFLQNLPKLLIDGKAKFWYDEKEEKFLVCYKKPLPLNLLHGVP